MTRNADPLPQIRSAGTLSSRAAAELEERILLGGFPQGHRLPPETELAQMLGVSRTVVRDAIRTLAARGLVSVRQGVGTVVTPPSDVAFTKALFLLLLRSNLTISDVFAARIAIETQLVPLAATRANDGDIAALERTLQELAESISNRDFDRARESHLRFHARLIEAIHLPALSILLTPIQQIILLSWERPLSLMTQKSWEKYANTHRPIVNALRARNETQLLQAMQQHFAAFSRKPFPAMPKERFNESKTVRALLARMSDNGENRLNSDSK